MHAKMRHLARLEGGVLAGVAGAGTQLLGLLAAVVALVLNTDLLDAGSASASDGGNVAVVGVDAGKDLAAGRLHVLDGDGTLGAVTLAVTARAVELAEVGSSEAVDGDGRGAVVLDDPGESLVADTLMTQRNVAYLSAAPRAPPPVTLAVPAPLKVRASSQTAVHQTSRNRRH